MPDFLPVAFSLFFIPPPSVCSAASSPQGETDQSTAFGRLGIIILHYTFKAHMKKKESRQSGPTFPGMGRYRRSRGIGCITSQGTHEADCQNALGTDEKISKQEALPSGTPRRGERANRFEESMIFIFRVKSVSLHTCPRSQLPGGSLTTGQ